MKILLAFLLACSAALAADAPMRTVLLTSERNGVTTTLYVGDINGTQSPSGVVTLQIVPLVEKKDSAGNVIASSKNTEQALTITLTKEQYAGIAALLRAAFEARAAAPSP